MDNKQLILNVDIIANDTLLPNYAVSIEGDKIKEIMPMRELTASGCDCRQVVIHDGNGSYLCPGFIDIHSDNIESAVQPRPASVMDFGLALMEHEKQLVNQGITTMFHSLSFVRKDAAVFRDKEARNPDKMKVLAELIKSLHERSHLIRHRFHCRFDIRNSEGYETLMNYIENGYVHLLSFNDHTPGQGQFRDLVKYREHMKGYKPNLEEEQIDDLIKEKMSIPKISRDQIERTAAVAREKGIPIASHDDDSEEKIEYVCSELKANISEFPVELKVARKAKEKGMLTVAGAPNVLLGKSHTGNLSATEAILDGSIDILCSDYYPPSLLHAVFKLNTDYGLPLWKCINLVTFNPAKALGIEKEYGSVAAGKKADLLMIRLQDGKPAITKVFIDGVLVSELNYRRVLYA